ERLARPDLGVRRVGAAAVALLDPAPLPLLFERRRPLPLVQPFVEALPLGVDRGLAVLLAHLVGLLRVDHEAALRADHVRRPLQVAAVGVVVGGIVGVVVPVAAVRRIGERGAAGAPVGVG